MSAVDFGRARLPVRTRLFSTVLNTRIVVVALACAAVCVASVVVALCNGDYPLAPAEAWAALTGHAPAFTTTVVVEWRLPRAVSAVVFGAALAVAGALVQSLTRNPLGSPDVIGLNAGAYTGVLLGITVLGGSIVAVTTGAFVAAVLTALLVWGVAGRARTGDGFVIVGVGVAAALTAVNGMIVLRATTEVAQRATIWGQGALDDVRWPQLAPALVVLAVLAVAVAVVTTTLRPLELGNDLATTLGTRVGVVRMVTLVVAVLLTAAVTSVAGPVAFLALVVAVLLTAAVTSVAGPVAFLALVAPHLARYTTRSAGTTIVGSAAVGAALLSVSDLIAQYLFPQSVPVGVVTVVAGGGYFIVLLLQRLRRG